MSSLSPRRLLVALVVTVVTAATAVVALASASPAHALDTEEGNLQIKAGSYYTESPVVGLATAPGKWIKYGLKVVNPSPYGRQYKVVVDGLTDGNFPSLAVSTTHYLHTFWTPVIPPGGSTLVTVQDYINPNPVESQFINRVRLSDAEGSTVYDEIHLVSSVAHTTGTKRHDLFLKTGSQPWVGGSVDQFETANALRVGQTATFSLRLRNDGTSPTSGITVIGSFSSTCAGDYTVKVAQGLANVTAAVMSSGYALPGTLNPGGYKDFQVTVKRVTATPGCTQALVSVAATGPDGSITQSGQVVNAV